MATFASSEVFRRISHDLRIITVYLVDRFLPRTSSLRLLNVIQLTLVLTFAIVTVRIMK
jgi:hypothetical protein